MKTFLLSLGAVSVWLIAIAPAQADEPLWLCHRQDGSEIYTTDPGALKDCKQYTPPVGITQAPDLDKDRTFRDQPGRSYEKFPPRERGSEETPKPKGEIEFEQFRMLDTGMTEAEIITRVGNPKHVFRFGRNIERWVYSTPDEWLIEVTFLSGRVSNIDWYRPRP